MGHTLGHIQTVIHINILHNHEENPLTLHYLAVGISPQIFKKNDPSLGRDNKRTKTHARTQIHSHVHSHECARSTLYTV